MFHRAMVAQGMACTTEVQITVPSSRPARTEHAVSSARAARDGILVKQSSYLVPMQLVQDVKDCRFAGSSISHD